MRSRFHVCARPQNLRRICRELGENLSDDELRVRGVGTCRSRGVYIQRCFPVQAMIDEFDRDQDGEINESEFMYIMKQTSVD